MLKPKVRYERQHTAQEYDEFKQVDSKRVQVVGQSDATGDSDEDKNSFTPLQVPVKKRSLSSNDGEAFAVAFSAESADPRELTSPTTTMPDTASGVGSNP